MHAQRETLTAGERSAVAKLPAWRGPSLLVRRAVGAGKAVLLQQDDGVVKWVTDLAPSEDEAVVEVD